MKRAIQPSGAEAFEAYYGGIYGARWPALREALLGPGRRFSLRIGAEGGFEARPAEAAATAGSESEAGTDAICTDPTEEGPAPYFLDEASIQAASALDLPASGQILDACAAPGGKSLVLAARMSASCRLLCNELSPDRRRRLGAVLDASLPPTIRSRVSILGADASSLCLRRPGAFDAILLDAPCSSEAHVLADPAALSAWTPNRPASLARRQWALLSSAFLMLAPGASLVYSTCSLNPGENDGVAQRLLERRGADLEVLPPSLPGAEATAYGAIILPDRSGGAGPMYVLKLRRRA